MHMSGWFFLSVTVWETRPLNKTDFLRLTYYVVFLEARSIISGLAKFQKISIRKLIYKPKIQKN